MIDIRTSSSREDPPLSSSRSQKASINVTSSKQGKLIGALAFKVLLKSSAVERVNTGGPTASLTMKRMTQPNIIATVGLANVPAMESITAHLITMRVDTTALHLPDVIGTVTVARHLLECDGTIHQTTRRAVVAATAITNGLTHKVVVKRLITRNRAI